MVYTTGTNPHILHTALYKDSVEIKLPSESRTSHYLQIDAVAELLNSETAALRAELNDMQALVERLSLEKSEVLIEQGELAAELAKAQADLAAAQAIIIDAGKQVEALKAENARLESAVTDVAIWIKRYAYTVRGADEMVNALREILQPAPEPLAAENAAPKAQTTPSRCRVNWNQRGFSSGSYEVLGHSDEKQAYMLNISTDENKPMLKMVRMTDCEALS